MKSIADIKKLIAPIQKQINKNGTISKADKKALKFYRTMLLYLETKPKEKSLQQQLQTLKKRIKSIESSFSIWSIRNYPDMPFKKQKSKFNSEMNIPLIKSFIKTLEFLLTDVKPITKKK